MVDVVRRYLLRDVDVVEEVFNVLFDYGVFFVIISDWCVFSIVVDEYILLLK